MIRTTLASAVAVMSMGALASPAAATAQACRPPSCPATSSAAGAGTVVVDTSDLLGPVHDRGILSRSDRPTPAPLLAAYLGASVLGVTLFAVTARQRFARLREMEMQTGLARGRRDPADFWRTSTRPPAAAPAPRSTESRTAGHILLGSASQLSISQHRPAARAGNAGGANDG